MKIKYNLKVILLALSACLNAQAGPAIFSGNDIKILKPALDLNGIAKLLTGTADPTVTAPETAPQGSLYLRTGAGGGSLYVKTDAGISTNWTIFSAGGGSGITTLNTLTNATQTFATGTTGSDFGIVSTAGVHTFNLPSASASNRGLLLAADWTTFNTKEPAITSGSTSQYFRGDKSFQTLNTTAVTEAANLYYTDARVYTASKTYAPAQILYVTKDNGNDANDCSLLKPCKTIQAGINAANAIAAFYKQVVVQVAPNSGSPGYSENITFSQQGVILQCANLGQNSRGCVINGTVTVNLTGTSGGANFIAASNEVYMNGMVVTAGAGTALTFSGSTYQKITIADCYLQAGAGQAVVETNTGVTGSTPSSIISYDTTFENNSASNPTVTLTAGRFWMYGTTPAVQNTNASGPSFTQNGASSMIANLTQFTGQYNLTDNTATATFNLATIASGTNPCIVTPSSPSTGYALLAYFGCNSSNTNSITGTGVVVVGPGSIRFGSSGDIVSTVTQALVGPGLPQGEIMIGAGAVSGTNVLLSVKNGHVKIAQTTAPTVLVSSNAGTGGACSVSNAVDSAGKISLTTGSLSTVAGTQCTVTFNKAYGVAPICSFSPTSATAAANAVSRQINFPAASTTAMTINFGIAETVGSTYTWNYHCFETQ